MVDEISKKLLLQIMILHNNLKPTKINPYRVCVMLKALKMLSQKKESKVKKDDRKNI